MIVRFRLVLYKFAHINLKPVLALTLALLAVSSWSNDSNSLDKGLLQEAVFAGGCFWCMEPPFDKTEGVLETISGYTGGKVDNPTYKQVSAGYTGHYEVVKVTYDPSKVSYETLLEIFWRNVDPFDGKGQFCDKGTQYLSGIFVSTDEERKLAEESKKKVSAKLNKKVVTEILPAAIFYPAEKYHQDYYVKNPIRYKWYRSGCGRDRRLEAVWGNS